MKNILISLAVLAFMFSSTFAEDKVWNSKCKDKEIWKLVETYHKKHLPRSESKNLKIKDIEFEETQWDSIYYCRYVLKTNKLEKDHTLTIKKINEETRVSFGTESYTFK